MYASPFYSIENFLKGEDMEILRIKSTVHKITDLFVVTFWLEYKYLKSKVKWWLKLVW